MTAMTTVAKRFVNGVRYSLVKFGEHTKSLEQKLVRRLSAQHDDGRHGRLTIQDHPGKPPTLR